MNAPERDAICLDTDASLYYLQDSQRWVEGQVKIGACPEFPQRAAYTRAQIPDLEGWDKKEGTQ